MAVSTQVSTLNRVRYGGLDFDTHFDDLRARVQVQFAEDFNDFALSSLGIMLLDLVAYGLDSLSFYLDRRASDAYLDTARTRKAVARLSRQLGYKMGAAVSSSVDLNVAISTPGGYAFSVPIPKGFQFKGPDDLIYETADLVTFPPNSGPTDIRSIPCYEGETITENFVSTGEANQFFELRRVPPSKFIVQGTVQVIVNGAPWTESDFLSFDETDQFEVGYNDEPPSVRFGDGVAGNIPDLGAPIVVIYVASRGKAGQISAGAITEPVTPLVVSFTTIPLTINNPEAPEGGDDPESIAKVKVLAGRVFKSRQVAVTRGDYQALSNAFADPLYGRVAAAQAISSRSAEQDIFLQNSIAEIKNLIDPIKEAVNDLTLNSSALSGSILWTNASTTVLGTGTKFLTEIANNAGVAVPGQFIKKATDLETLYVEVATVVSDTSLTLVANYTGTSGTAGGVLTTSTVGARGVLTRLLLVQEELNVALTTTAVNNDEANTALGNVLTSAQSSKNSAVSIANDANDIITEATTAGAQVALLPVATPNLAIGSGSARVLYVAKVAGAVGASVRVAHVAGGALAVNVVARDITVTVAPADTAAQVAAAVMANGLAAALVDAYALGAANANPPAQTLTYLGYTSPNSLAVSGIPDTDQALLQQRLDRCKTEANNISTTASGLQTAIDGTIIANALTAQDKVNESGLNLATPGTTLFTAEQARSATVAAIGTVGGPTGLYLTFANIDAEVAPLDTTLEVGPPDTVGTHLDEIYNHIDVLLSDDCKSNLVSVPILTHNAAGFYTGPTLGLQQALQSYLDARKEVTQTVKVTSGERYLVRPVIVVRAGVKLGFSASVTKTAIASAIDSLLKDRDFGRSLYLSDFCIVEELVSGLEFLNVTIRGYNDADEVLQTDKLDDNGNLIIAASEVITKEQRLTLPLDQAGVTINTEIVTPT